MFKPFRIPLAGLVLCALNATAAIQGFFTTSPSFVVPTNKILVLQAVVPAYNDPALNTLVLTPTSGAALTLHINAAATNGLYPLVVTLKLPAGTTVAGSGMALFGLLVDPQDLYVGINSTLTNPSYAGGLFSGNVELASAAPPAVRMQTSADLSLWQYDSTIAVQPTVDKTNLLFSAAANGPDRFYRARVGRR